jgi:hypothetical protein
MAKYTVLIMVSPRMEAVFTREQIEQAARVVFYSHPPEQCTIYTTPDDLEILWTADFIRDRRAIQVIGDVEPE